MTTRVFLLALLLAFVGTACSQDEQLEIPMLSHPDTSSDGWIDLFAPDLSNAIDVGGVWTVENGVLTASEDEAIFSEQQYENYVLDLEVRTDPGANSGIILHTRDVYNWIPNAVEIQIGDDAHREGPPTRTQSGSAFGFVAPTKQMIKPPGEWNRYTVTALGDEIWVVLNGEFVTHIKMSEFTSAELTPDGEPIPAWLSTPLAELPPRGHIGFQGKHGDSPIWFRNIRLRELD